MQRNSKKYKISSENVGDIKGRILNWTKQFSILSFLDNNNYPTKYTGFECLAAVGTSSEAPPLATLSIADVQRLHDQHKDWMFGHICYDYKNQIEAKLQSTHQPIHNFPELYFFIPETVCHINQAKDTLTIETLNDPDELYDAILSPSLNQHKYTIPNLTFTSLTSKEDYISTVNRLRKHIEDGDCYEINYCQSGYCECTSLDSMEIFNALNTLSPSPFAAYYRLNDQYLMCASPERYLHKEGNNILSQPIKGTARRDANPTIDENIKTALLADIKERAENIMIVDLVRNDIAKCCEVGSVKVDELFGLYSFPQVHQMISTVSGILKPGANLATAIDNTFPMGSMTGAPKYKVMQLIDQYEHTRRELFSGTVGYITPNGDYDFNVIIRSLFYNQYTNYLSYTTGGAITYDSQPEKEYEEMRLKAWALERIFQ